MHRPYDVDEYRRSIERVRRAIPDVALATDIIVGFPGETEGDFRATMDVVEDVRFSKLHVFRYSPRPGTAAATLPDEVAPDTKRDRSKRLIEVGNRIRAGFLESHLRTNLEVLVEDEREVDGTVVASGQTDDYVRVWFEGRRLLGAMASVQPERVRADGIGGRLVEVTRR